jgi:hypothetical protein
VKKPGVGWVRWVLVTALVGCGKEAAVGEETMDADVDAGCPEYNPDAGVFLTRRGCPLTIDYAIR